MPLSEGWRDQYDRMLRSRDKLIEAAGPSSIGSDEARDRLYHFFQDAFHLRDWLHNSSDPAVAAKATGLKGPGNHISATPELALCADLCNGIKHFTLTWAVTGDIGTTIASQSVSVTLQPIEVKAYVGGAPTQPKAPTPPATAEHTWEITSDGQTWDAVDLADDIIDAWDDWLRAHGLL